MGQVSLIYIFRHMGFSSSKIPTNILWEHIAAKLVAIFAI